MGDDRRRRSSRSWFLPPSERRELYIARSLGPAVEMIVTWAIGAGADSITAERRAELEEAIQRVLNDSWSDGAHNEADLRTARDAEKRMRQIMETELRRHGIHVPTDRLPSDPPPKRDDD